MAAYDVSDAVTVNAQVSKGFRLGGVNDPLNVPLCSDEDRQIFGDFQAYNDEKLTNYEAGVKVNTGKFQLNAAAFYTKIKDLQVTLDAGSCSSRVTFNVPEAHTQGVEVEFKARPTEGLDVSLAMSVLESEFDSTVVDGGGNVLGGVRDGNRLASTPEFNLGANATYSFPFEIAGDGAEAYISATVQHRGTMFTQPGDQEIGGIGDSVLRQASGLPFGGASGNRRTHRDIELNAFTTANLSFGVMMESWEVIAYVKNITDVNANLSFDRERGGRARLGFRTNEPRTFGLTLRTNF
jgi:outer membrane receptor protein involved in Fe transport